MKLFLQHEIREAKEHAAAGGQALHVHRILPNRVTAPRCFVAAIDRGEKIAHLFDQDFDRLCATCRRLGVRVLKVEHRGEDGQHVDLCAGPLRKAIEEAEKIK